MKTLNLGFINSSNKKTSLKITNPNVSLNKDQIQSLMNRITELEIFIKEDTQLYKTPDSARLTSTNSEIIL